MEMVKETGQRRKDRGEERGCRRQERSEDRTAAKDLSSGVGQVTPSGQVRLMCETVVTWSLTRSCINMVVHVFMFSHVHLCVHVFGHGFTGSHVCSCVHELCSQKPFLRPR